MESNNSGPLFTSSYYRGQQSQNPTERYRQMSITIFHSWGKAKNKDEPRGS